MAVRPRCEWCTLPFLRPMLLPHPSNIWPLLHSFNICRVLSRSWKRRQQQDCAQTTLFTTSISRTALDSLDSRLWFSDIFRFSGCAHNLIKACFKRIKRQSFRHCRPLSSGSMVTGFDVQRPRQRDGRTFTNGMAYRNGSLTSELSHRGKGRIWIEKMCKNVTNVTETLRNFEKL